MFCALLPFECVLPFKCYFTQLAISAQGQRHLFATDSETACPGHKLIAWMLINRLFSLVTRIMTHFFRIYVKQQFVIGCFSLLLTILQEFVIDCLKKNYFVVLTVLKISVSLLLIILQEFVIDCFTDLFQFVIGCQVFFSLLLDVLQVFV